MKWIIGVSLVVLGAYFLIRKLNPRTYYIIEYDRSTHQLIQKETRDIKGRKAYTLEDLRNIQGQISVARLNGMYFVSIEILREVTPSIRGRINA